MTALRQELNATEAELVQRALQAGASWSRIARALGITKQAAHRKYRHVFERAFDASAGGSKVLATNEARQAMQFARGEAKRLGQSAVGTEHILLGILHCRQSRAVKTLHALGVTLETARRSLQTTMPGLPVKPSAGAPADGVTPQARRVLEGSLREALNRGEGHIGVEHLLLALLSDSLSGAVQTLEALRTTPAAVRRRLERQRPGTAAETTVHETVTAPPPEPAPEPGPGAPAGTPAAPIAGRGGQVTSRSRPVSTS